MNVPVPDAIRYIHAFIKPRGPVPATIFPHLLAACTRQNDLISGRQIQSLIQEFNLQFDIKLSCLLIHMFASCGSIPEAFQVFQRLPGSPHVHAWDAIILVHVQHGLCEEAISLYSEMRRSSTSAPTTHIFVAVLKTCGKISALHEGRLIHADTIKQEVQTHIFVGTALIEMYSKCSSLADARMVFDMLPVRDSVCWSAIISGCVRCGDCPLAFRYFRKLQQQGVQANKATYLCMIKACADSFNLNQVRAFHLEICKIGLELDMLITGALVDSYCKCDGIDHASKIFENSQLRSVVLWSSMIAGYVQHDQGEDAIRLFKSMHQVRASPDNVTYMYLIKACINAGDLDTGQSIHNKIVQIGIDNKDLHIQSSLIEMYVKFNMFNDAKKVFNTSQRNDKVSWAVMITAYIDNGYEEELHDLLAKMEHTDIEPDVAFFICLIKSCTCCLALLIGRLIHHDIESQGFQLDLHVRTALVGMYAKCNCIDDAYNIFEKCRDHDATCWSTLISSLVEVECAEEAKEMFEEMEQNGVLYDDVTICYALKACTKVGDLDKGKLIHVCILKSGFDLCLMIANALIDMYGKCASLESANIVFETLQLRNVASWTAMISAHIENEYHVAALGLVENMQNEGFSPDHITFMYLLRACAKIELSRCGESAHCEIVKRGIDSDTMIGNAMVDMYAKSGNITSAFHAFGSLHTREAIAWNPLLFRLSEIEKHEEVFQLFKTMHFENVEPDQLTYLAALKSCLGIANLSLGRLLHMVLTIKGFESQIVLENILISMYAKCGSVKDARRVFQRMQMQTVISWNAIMECYGEHGCCTLVLQCFRHMQERGVHLDDGTFVRILCACSHAGLIQEAYRILHSMTETLKPAMQHIVCIVDGLGRAGRLLEAKTLLTRMPLQPDAVVLMALLGSCARCDNILVAEWTYEHLIQLGLINSAGCKLLLKRLCKLSYIMEMHPIC